MAANATAPAMANSTTASRGTLAMSNAATSAVMPDAPSPNHGSHFALLTQSRIIVTGATNGAIDTIGETGAPGGPNHHVPRPSSLLVFQTATKATKANPHTMAVAIRHPGVNCPATGGRNPGAAPSLA